MAQKSQTFHLTKVLIYSIIIMYFYFLMYPEVYMIKLREQGVFFENAARL